MISGGMLFLSTAVSGHYYPGLADATRARARSFERLVAAG
jgi:hypothetical protein